MAIGMKNLMERNDECAQSSRRVQVSLSYLRSSSPPFSRPRSMIIVPSSALETMNLGAMGGLAALSQTQMSKKEPERPVESYRLCHNSKIEQLSVVFGSELRPKAAKS